MCVCLCVCVRACVRACVCVCDIDLAVSFFVVWIACNFPLVVSQLGCKSCSSAACCIFILEVHVYINFTPTPITQPRKSEWNGVNLLIASKFMCRKHVHVSQVLQAGICVTSKFMRHTQEHVSQASTCVTMNYMCQKQVHVSEASACVTNKYIIMWFTVHFTSRLTFGRGFLKIKKLMNWKMSN